MSINHPQVRIKDAWLLRANASTYLNELWGGGEPLRSEAEYRKLTNEYINAWQPYEERVMTGMTELLDLEFRQNIIDVYVAPWFSAFSDPLVIGVTNEPDMFVDTLTHEIIHRLISDNTTVPHDLLLGDEWRSMFGKDHTPKTLVHIPVLAVHKAIFLDVLNEPERLKREIDGYQDVTDWDPSDYIKAWEYVEEYGYKEIIEQLKESYQKLAE